MTYSLSSAHRLLEFVEGGKLKLRTRTIALNKMKAQPSATEPSLTESPRNGAAVTVQQGSSGEEGDAILPPASVSSCATMGFPGSSSIGTDGNADSEVNCRRRIRRASTRESLATVPLVRQPVTATLILTLTLTP